MPFVYDLTLYSYTQLTEEQLYAVLKPLPLTGATGEEFDDDGHDCDFCEDCGECHSCLHSRRSLTISLGGN